MINKLSYIKSGVSSSDVSPADSVFLSICALFYIRKSSIADIKGVVH